MHARRGVKTSKRLAQKPPGEAAWSWMWPAVVGFMSSFSIAYSPSGSQITAVGDANAAEQSHFYLIESMASSMRQRNF
jgi:hypothetical protein